MSRYIDEKEALRQIELHSNSDGILDTSLAYVALKNCPNIDAVEVVRCKNCEHWECNPGTDRYGSCQKVAYDDFEVVMNANDFCSYGEKKEQENE